MTAAAEPRLSAHDLHEAIRARYEPPEWHLETEVTLAGRRLDVVALNMWETRGWRVVGFEIKVSRGDWVRELNAFQKSEEWTAVVDAFYVVTPPKLVRDGELPEGWGHLELCGSRMMTRRHAAVRDGRTTLPREVAARFIGRLAQRATQEERTAEHRARQQLRDDVESMVRTRIEAEWAGEREELQRLRTEHRALLDALGVNPISWRAHEASLRAAGVFARATEEPEQLRGRLQRLGEQLGEQSKTLLDAASTLSAIHPDLPPHNED